MLLLFLGVLKFDKKKCIDLTYIFILLLYLIRIFIGIIIFLKRFNININKDIYFCMFSYFYYILNSIVGVVIRKKRYVIK